MKNQVIEVLDREHGKKVIQYWKDRGVDTGELEGTGTKESGKLCRYYGVLNGKFGPYMLVDAIHQQAEIITLPEPEDEWKPKFGEKVLVWDDGYTESNERVFITKAEGDCSHPYIVVARGDEDRFSKGETFAAVCYQHIKPYKKEVTMQEIADKFGVSVEQLKIKK